RKTIGRPFIGGGELGHTGRRVAGGEVGDGVITLDRPAVLGVYRRDRRIGRGDPGEEQRQQAGDYQTPQGRERETTHDHTFVVSPGGSLRQDVGTVIRDRKCLLAIVAMSASHRRGV